MDLRQALTRVALDGFCVVGGAIPAADVAAVRESVERATAAHGRDEARDQGIGHVPVWGLVSEDILTLEGEKPPDYKDDGEEH